MEPDGDCIGSQLALASVLKRMGKEAVLCSSGPFKRTEIKNYENHFTASPEVKPGDRAFILDCASFDRIGNLEAIFMNLPCAVIDHHESGSISESSGSLNFLYLDKKAPSTTYLVFQLIEALGFTPTREEAEFLFFGLCTDTGFFRHADSKSKHTFNMAADLIHYGANPKNTFADIHGGKSLDSRKLLAHVLLRAEPHFEGKLILSWENIEETEQYGREGRDSDSLYQLLQSVEGVEAIVIIRQEKPEYCTVGFRSRDSVDVGIIARHFGGGGHKNAAGLKIDGKIDQIKTEILNEFSKIFNNR